MSSSASSFRDGEGGRLGGARAELVAWLGRKVSEARELLSTLEEDPSSRPARDELRRRLHALGSSARLLRFNAMTSSLQEVLAVLDRGATQGGLGEADIAFAARVLDDLPALAWAETAVREARAHPPATEEAAPAGLPTAVLGGADKPLAPAPLPASGSVPPSP